MDSLYNEIRTYLVTKYKITRLEISEKIIIAINLVFQVIIFVMLLSVVLIVLSFALANYIGMHLDNAGLGFLIVSGIDVLLLLIFIIFRKALILKPLSKIFIPVLLHEDREEEEEDDDNEI
jgi:hypothetical protein